MSEKRPPLHLLEITRENSQMSRRRFLEVAAVFTALALPESLIGTAQNPQSDQQEVNRSATPPLCEHDAVWEDTVSEMEKKDGISEAQFKQLNPKITNLNDIQKGQPITLYCNKTYIKRIQPAKIETNHETQDNNKVLEKAVPALVVSGLTLLGIAFSHIRGEKKKKHLENLQTMAPDRLLELYYQYKDSNPTRFRETADEIARRNGGEFPPDMR